MATNRRDFLKGTAWMGVLAAAGGCVSRGIRTCSLPASMQGFKVDPIKTPVKVGFVGVGRRAMGALKRISSIPGMRITAVCDLMPERIAAAQDVLKQNNAPAAKEFLGPNGYDAMLQEDLDVVYNVTPWDLHASFGVKAMNAGKHVMIEVPAAMTIEECWELVETAERTKKHCMQLENCAYGEAEMLCLNLVRKGILGEIFHGEAAYIHDLHSKCYFDAQPDPRKYPNGYTKHWRLMHNAKHKGNQYATHGLVPVSQYMNINRGDRFETLVSLESDQFTYGPFAAKKYPGTWKEKLPIAMGNMNQSIIRTAMGRTILVQHDVSSPRPYSRLNVCSGTNGIFTGITFVGDQLDEFGYSLGNPVRFCWKEEGKEHINTFFPYKKMKLFREEYKHPLWKQVGKAAQLIGGHGGMDFIMDLRWCYCLQNGLPLDTDVYDLAATCSVAELSERSVRSGGNAVDVPDFTSGGWKTAKPLGIVDIDLVKMGFDPNAVVEDKNALNV